MVCTIEKLKIHMFFRMQIYHSYVIFAGVTVTFLQSSYIITEGDIARVCFNVIGATDVEITVGVITSPVETECMKISCMIHKVQYQCLIIINSERL